MKKTGKRVQIDWDELETAFDWNDPESHAYLDLETGEVVRWSDPRRGRRARRDHRSHRREARPLRADRASREPRVLALDGGVRRDGRRTRPPAPPRPRARGKGAFRRFKMALEGEPAERERWFAFRDERLHAALEAWLAGLEIEIANPPPWR